MLTKERECRQCEMLESEAADFCVDDDGRMAAHNWIDPRDAEIKRLREALVMLMHCGPHPRMGEWKRAIQNASEALGDVSPT